MIVKEISNDEGETDISGSPFVCKIELTHKEAKAIVHSLGRTHCRGEQLTVSMELEDKIWEVIKHNN